MVHADVSGVTFSADPVSGRRAVAVVSAVEGLGTRLVGGDADADTWEVDRESNFLSRPLGRKPTDSSPDSVHAPASTTSGEGRPTLTDQQVLAVVDLSRGLAAVFGGPQDVEWAYEKETLYLLQTRPITTLAPLVDPDGQIRVWDNSNITESYSGVTTPLTFTFARRAYEGVYRRFCQLLAVPQAKIVAHQSTFREMLGLLQGRVYYNLLNWYRVLALLPGFTLNRRFMEQMMGVKDPLPADLLAEVDRALLSDRVKDGWRLVLMVGVIIAHFCLLPRRVRQFQARLEEALRPPSIPLEAQRAEELAAYFLELEGKLLTRWDAPLLNDFFTMIFSGILRRLVVSWCHDEEGTLLPALLSGRTDVISGEPARRIAELAGSVRNHSDLAALLNQGSLAEILLALRRHPELERALESYLAQFGDRCLDELKLESPTLRDDPLPLLRSVGRLASLAVVGNIAGHGQVDPRGLAEQQVRQQLGKSPWRRAIFQWVLRQAKIRTRDRENLRFERTRLFGRVRQVFVWVGRRLAADGHLDEARDVFHLELEEILGFLGGRATTTSLRGLARMRKDEFEQYRQGPSLPNRVTTRGCPYQGPQLIRPARLLSGTEGEVRRGVSCSPGVADGVIRVVRYPRTASIRGGEILVAEHTDPGWILLLPGARGLLVERGSLLSHSAIVARELQLPTIVAIDGLTDWLKDGDRVEMDGGTGIVRRLTRQADVGSSADAHHLTQAESTAECTAPMNEVASYAG